MRFYEPLRAVTAVPPAAAVWHSPKLCGAAVAGTLLLLLYMLFSTALIRGERDVK